jgi:alkyl sulfatase BDS1-like metallo-beta-lactamase superfamily hydrolase
MYYAGPQLHDQTLRLMNQGLTGSEIAEVVEIPPELDPAWHTHGYYGSFSHGVKAVYQRYLGWYDGNPAHLWPHPPEAAASRYVEALGGIDATVAAARRYLDRGDLRFAAELGSHAVFADPEHPDAREVLATTFERLGYGAENATWRNCYLVGAQELRSGVAPTTISDTSGLAPAMTVTQLFDSVAIRIVGPKAWNERLAVEWHFTDSGERYRWELSNGALVHYPTTRTRPANATVRLTRGQLLGLLAGAAGDGVVVDGDAGVLARLMSLTDGPDHDFPVVTP